MFLFISQLQHYLASIPFLQLGCTCETVNFISMIAHISFLALLIFFIFKIPWIRGDIFFRSVILGGILLVISEFLDWWHIVQVAIHRNLIFSYGIDSVVEILQLTGFLIILIGLIKIWRKSGL